MFNGISRVERRQLERSRRDETRAAAWSRTRRGGCGRWGWPTDSRYLDGGSWTAVANDGAGGNSLRRDPTRPATVWAANVAEVTRTDGTYRYSRDYTQFPELDTQSDLFHTVAPAPDGIAWLGSTQGLFRLDANAGTYQYFAALGGLSTIGAIPLAVTPDGRLWFNLFDPNGTARTAWRGSTATRPGSIRAARRRPAVGRTAPRPDRRPRSADSSRRLRALDELPVARHRRALRARPACSPTASKAVAPRAWSATVP